MSGRTYSRNVENDEAHTINITYLSHTYSPNVDIDVPQTINITYPSHIV